MTSRTYLSIGDVLTLLREEFPDVTISKIRFLESQGLVNPERSPSGYRKFFEHDVERLRWVLRQQREHFLPLKVIRDRLAAGDLGERGLTVAEPVERLGDRCRRGGGRGPDPVRRNGKWGRRGQRRPQRRSRRAWPSTGTGARASGPELERRRASGADGAAESTPAARPHQGTTSS